MDMDDPTACEYILDWWCKATLTSVALACDRKASFDNTNVQFLYIMFLLYKKSVCIRLLMNCDVVDCLDQCFQLFF